MSNGYYKISEVSTGKVLDVYMVRVQMVRIYRHFHGMEQMLSCGNLWMPEMESIIFALR